MVCGRLDVVVLLVENWETFVVNPVVIRLPVLDMTLAVVDVTSEVETVAESELFVGGAVMLLAPHNSAPRIFMLYNTRMRPFMLMYCW